MRQPIRVLFHLAHRAVKQRGMLCDVARDVEASALNGASIIWTYCCHLPVFGILEHVATDLRPEEANPLSQAAFFALTSDSCTDWSTKKEEML